MRSKKGSNRFTRSRTAPLPFHQQVEQIQSRLPLQSGGTHLITYNKTANGYELEGAMYTVPNGTSGERLNRRVVLRVGQWHAYVNLCFLRQGITDSTDWTRIGFKGAIATKEECEAAGGKFYSQVFGWMLHVYPFEQRPERIWTH